MRIRAGVVVAAILLAGCSDDGGDSTEDASPTGPAEDDPRTQEEWDADQAAAEEIVLTLADFEPGWEESSSDDEGPETDDINEELADCLGIPAEEFDSANPEAASKTFTSSADEEVNATVTVLASEKEAQEDMDRYSDDESLDCLAEAYRTLLGRAFLENADEVPEGLELGEPTLGRLSVDTIGDESHAIRLTVPMSASGMDVDLYIDLIATRVGRVGITTSFLSVLTPFFTDDAAEIVQAMADRVPSDI